MYHAGVIVTAVPGDPPRCTWPALYRPRCWRLCRRADPEYSQSGTGTLSLNIGDEGCDPRVVMACMGKAPEFDSSLESFGAYSRRLEQYFIANGIAEEDKRRAVFLSVVGAKTFGLLEDLIAPASVSECTDEELVKTLVTHFEPQTSVIVARYRFHTCHRSAQESVTAFLARLRKLAKPCEFAANVLEEMLRDRLVCGINHERLQSRLLSESKLTLQKALELAQAHESAAASAAELSGQAAVGDFSEPAVNRLQGGVGGRGAGARPTLRAPSAAAASPLPTREEECSRCLRRHPAASCPFRGKFCFGCGRRGHTRAACGSWSQQHLRQLSADESPSAVAAPAEDDSSDELPRPRREAPGSESSEMCDEAYALLSVRPDVCERRPPLMVRVSLDGRAVDMELDTGAALSVCSDTEFRRLWPDGGPDLEPCGVALKTYSGERLSVRGQAMVNVEYGGSSMRLPLVVVKGNGPCLFGRNWLSHIRLDWPPVCRVSPLCPVQPILEEFPEVLRDELGCYRGGEVTIDVDPDVRPRFFKPRTVPLAYREAVDKELEKQVQLGLWEPVRHSKWAAPLVVVPKADGGIRICGDYRLAVNRAAKVEQ